jgi:phage nucleotide-binding protein
LVLEVDRTITKTLAKKEIVKDTSRVFSQQVDNIDTCASRTQTLAELVEMKNSGQLEAAGIKTIAVDNISELERCILSDLGSKGKNKGVPAMADYQYMQFKLVNSLRLMKSLGVNVIWTAWETSENFTHPDGTQYTRLIPKVSAKIVDNICGLCDVVGKILINKEGQHGILLEATQNIYAKNQIDNRKACKVEDFAKFGR